MDSITETLDTPLFLVAMPQVHDGFFDHSVVLLMQHGPEGSLGLIVNKPTQLTLPEVVQPLGFEWKGRSDEVVWFGGPVGSNLGTVLLREGETPPTAAGRALPIAPGLRMIQDVEILRELSVTPPASTRLLLGYAGWQEGQLEQELERSDWLIAPYDVELVIGAESENAWVHALRSINVRPESLPSFTTGTPQSSN